MMKPFPFDFQEGAQLPAITREIRQQNVNLYAKASRDYNPIHLDEAFAKQTAFGGAIAHGMFILAIASEMLTQAFGKHWLTSGKLNVRFKSAARPGDVIRASGQIMKLAKADGKTTIKVNILCANQKDEAVISGDAILVITD